MISHISMIDVCRRLLDMRDGDEYITAAAAQIQRLLPCDDVLWADCNWTTGQFGCWRSSTQTRDAGIEKVVPLLLEHPTVQDYITIRPTPYSPRRLADEHRERERHQLASQLFAEYLGPHQMGFGVRVIPPAHGRGWSLGRQGREFADDELEIAAQLMPLLIVLDRLHQPRIFADIGEHSALCQYEDRWEDLTVREEQVVDLMSAGMTAHAIASTLGITQATVRKHLEHIYRKLGHHDRLLVAIDHDRRRA